MLAPISRTVECSLATGGVEVELVTFSHPLPLADVFEGDERPVISLSLSPRVIHTRAAVLDADGHPGPWARVGDVVFCPGACRLLVVSPAIDAYRSVRLSYDPALVAEIRGQADPWSPRQLAAALDIQSPAIRRDLFRIVKEVSETGIRREKVVESAARLVLVELVRFMAGVAERPMRALRGSLADWQMRRIRDYVEGMIDRCPTVEELARACDIGSRHLMRAYKATTGRTIGEYIGEVRMTKAKSLLADTPLPQKEIAYRVGFSGPSTFCAAFGKAVGMTPKQFRMRHRN